MTNKIHSDQSIKPVLSTFQLISKRWITSILWVLATYQPTKFSTFSDNIPGINPRILSRRLTELQKEKIIVRKETKLKQPEISYTLTKKGEDLIKVLHPLAEWAHKWS